MIRKLRDDKSLSFVLFELIVMSESYSDDEVVRHYRRQV